MGKDDAKAIRLLNEQLQELERVRFGLNYKDPQFKAWRDTTWAYLVQFLPPNSPHLDRFGNLYFASRSFRRAAWGSRPKPPSYVSPQDQEHFMADCRTAEATIKAVLKHVGEFGVHSEQAPSRTYDKARSAVHQNIYAATVSMNQAIATDDATQSVGQLGNAEGASLKEVAEIFRKSMDLTRRQLQDGVVAIAELNTEVQKPEPQRNWKSVLDYGQGVLTVADKATDVAHKLASYKPAIVALVEKARHMLE